MSQTSVSDYERIAYEGKLQFSAQLPTTIVTGIANELIYFGKAVSYLTAAEVTAGDQKIQLPALTTDITELAMGVAVADTTREEIATTYGGYPQYSAVNVLRKGYIWVVSEDAVDDLTKGVYVRYASAGTPPAAALGSFRATTAANFQQWTGGVAWKAGTQIGAVYYGLLELNLV